ncbi:BZ3500_MvSof-1268-A1-R1_Chr7-1g09156 [Microbotryum saponariae]|uniref:BZ3500_MvSof-1268-A1-R1_Chr7-1g09156 protein n=1 Tax=Microbotryum saponariae TaxID=289078 RepID=A0A2X0N6P6_9BASI|nr:BZ3501_MvSof-1269-A2-R1_Chr7-1g08861 [Microbotryum saponariae]SDA02902.1 BZ3500_MvSof-1268-A1-R1_Chr7-1g09156 [Microbotryum saponariae]
MLFSTALLASLLVAVSAKKGLLAAHYPAYEVDAIIDWKVTDIGYHIAAVTAKDGLAFPAGEKGLAKFVSGAHANKKKAVLSIGGADGSQYFSSLVKTESARAKFVKQILEVVIENKLDGVNVDWRFPTVPGNPKNEIDPADSANLLKFLQDLRHSRPNDWISAAVSVNGIFGPSGTTTLTDYKPFAKVVDAFNVMAYDYVGGWTNQTGPDSPSYKCGTGRSFTTDIERFIEAGFPANKIILGVPSFDKAFTLHDSKLRTSIVYGDQQVPKKYRTRIFQNYDTYNGADYTYVKLKAQGILAGEDGLTTGKGYTRHYDHCSRTPFLFNPHTKIFITYLDARSAAYRAQRAVELRYLVFNAIDKALRTPIGGFASP